MTRAWSLVGIILFSLVIPPILGAPIIDESDTGSGSDYHPASADLVYSAFWSPDGTIRVNVMHNSSDNGSGYPNADYDTSNDRWGGDMMDGWFDFQGWPTWIFIAIVAIVCFGIFGRIGDSMIRSQRRTARRGPTDPSPPVKVKDPIVASPPVQAPVSQETTGLKEILSEFADVQIPLFFEAGRTEQASIQVENRTTEPLREVRIDLTDVAQFFEISSQSFDYQELKPGISLIEEFTMKPLKREGTFPVVIRFSSGSVEVQQQWEIQVGGTQID